MWEDARGCYGVQAIAPDALIDVWDQSGKDFWRLYDVPDVVKVTEIWVIRWEEGFS